MSGEMNDRGTERKEELADRLPDLKEVKLVLWPGFVSVRGHSRHRRAEKDPFVDRRYQKIGLSYVAATSNTWMCFILTVLTGSLVCSGIILTRN